MPPRLRTISVVLGVFLALAGARAAQAADANADELAKRHFLTGQSYYQQGRYQEAINEFKTAYDLSDRPALLYNIGQAYERLGELNEAVAHYEVYLKKERRPDPAIRAKVTNLKKRLAKTGIRVRCAVEGATVLVDGKAMGETPSDGVIATNPGSHTVRVEKAGYAPFSAFVSVTAGSAVEVKASLVPADAAAIAGAAEDVIAAEEGKERGRFWTWVAFGSAGALLITGATTGILALGDANDSTTSDGPKADSARTLALVSDITLGLGAAAAVAGAILFFVEGSDDEESPPAAATVAPALGPNYAGLNAHIRF